MILFSTTTEEIFAATTYLYDTNGNMTSDGNNCYTYNEANQLSVVKNCSSGQKIAEYIYDYNGNRLVKKEYTNGTLTATIYSPTDSYETDKDAATGTTKNSSYYFANNQLLAKKNPDGSKEYALNDQLGSNSTMTDASGNVVENTTYDPWGLVMAGGTQSKFQYTGQEKDSETGLNYYNARYYNPTIRRFTQADTIYPDVYNPQSLNRYSYVTNNPLRYTDPTGHCLEDACIAEATLATFLLTDGAIWLNQIAPRIITDPRLYDKLTNFTDNPSFFSGIDVAQSFMPDDLTSVFGAKTPAKLDKIYNAGNSFNEYYPYAYGLLSSAIGKTTPSRSIAVKNPVASSVPMSSFTENKTSAQSAKVATNNSNISNNSNMNHSVQNSSSTNFNNQIYLTSSNTQRVSGFTMSFSINSLMKNFDPYHFIKL